MSTKGSKGVRVVSPAALLQTRAKRKCAARAIDGMEEAIGGVEEAQAEGASREVGRMVDSSQADDRKMIRLVKERRLLYARNNMPVASYYTRVKGLWREVAQKMGWSVADVRRKWSHIRNSYSRHLRNEMHGARTGKGRMVSRWYLADELEFLREHMATDMRPSHYSTYAPTLLDMDLTEGKAEPVDIKPFMSSPWFSLGSAPFEPKLGAFAAPPAANDDSCSSAFEPDENSSYFQFFRGIHVDYQELSTKQQRLFKRKCLDFLHELLDEEEVAKARAEPCDAMNLSSAPHASDDERDTKICIVERVTSYAQPDQ